MGKAIILSCAATALIAASLAEARAGISLRAEREERK